MASTQSVTPETRGRPAAHVWVPQLEKADCGLAALAMVARRLGAGVSMEELRQKVTPGPEGLNLRQLRHLAEELGLPCQSVRVSGDWLGRVRRPAVAHLSEGHYVVLHELGAGGVVVGDPATGIVTWSREFLTRRVSGALLLFDRAGGEEQ